MDVALLHPLNANSDTYFNGSHVIFHSVVHILGDRERVGSVKVQPTALTH